MAITNPSNELLQPLCSNDAEMVGFEIKKPPKVSFKQEPGINNKTIKQLQISICSCFQEICGATTDTEHSTVGCWEMMFFFLIRPRNDGFNDFRVGFEKLRKGGWINMMEKMIASKTWDVIDQTGSIQKFVF